MTTAEMSPALAAPRFRYSLPPFSALTVAALLGVAASFTYAALTYSDFENIGIIIVIAAVVAGFVATRWRWTPALALVAFAAAAPFAIPEALNYHRYNAEQGADLALGYAVVPVLIVVVGISSVVALWQNYRRPVERRTAPAWLKPALLIGGGALAGVAVVGISIPSHGATARVTMDSLDGFQSVAAANETWTQTELHVKAGEVFARRIDNADNMDHTFDVPEFDIHAPLPAGESALVMFKATTPGRYTFKCAIPGHDMKGVIIVDR
jgi:uncharacterized cupredoxin-like copper-binding protein